MKTLDTGKRERKGNGEAGAEEEDIKLQVALRPRPVQTRVTSLPG